MLNKHDFPYGHVQNLPMLTLLVKWIKNSINQEVVESTEAQIELKHSTKYIYSTKYIKNV